MNIFMDEIPFIKCFNGVHLYAFLGLFQSLCCKLLLTLQAQGNCYSIARCQTELHDEEDCLNTSLNAIIVIVG